MFFGLMNLNVRKSSVLLQIAYNMGVVYAAPSGLFFFISIGASACVLVPADTHISTPCIYADHAAHVL